MSASNRDIHDVIYLDNNATTPCAPEVIDAMVPFMRDSFGNPSSPHLLGRIASSAITRSRETIAGCIGCSASEVYFTSGATESNNIIIQGLTGSYGRRKIVVSSIEHKSVLEPIRRLADQGFDIVSIPVDASGVIDIDSTEQLVDDDTLLVSLQSANNEVGTIQPVDRVSEIAHSHGALVHCDCAQLLGKIDFSAEDLGADFLTFSGHKAYGPKGAGLLVALGQYANDRLRPIMFGGSQEGGIRPGTLNVPGIVGVAAAVQLCKDQVGRDSEHIKFLRSKMESMAIERLPLHVIAGIDSDRLPGTSALIFDGIPADVLVARSRQLCVGLGSACSSGSVTPSHVLTSMGYTWEQARSLVRISIGRYNTIEDIYSAISILADASQYSLSGRIA